MKQVLVQLDDRTAAQLEDVAPGRSHKRSQFLRQAIARALQDALEVRTRAAYAKWPDEAPRVDPQEWAPEAEALHPQKKRAAKRRARSKA
jgi:hypothetical protein